MVVLCQRVAKGMIINMNVFDRLAPFVQDFIYQNKWEELRGIQVAACEVIFDSDDNLLLSSGTASGKTRF
jgi:ATP-dependent Lhr-like helicase